MNIISQYLNFSDYNHTILWPACCLRFFGFLCAGEFTDNSHFNPNIHIAVSDVHINIKYSMMDPFRQGCYIYIGAEKRDLCPMHPLPSIYMCVAQLLAHISFSLRHPSKLTMADIWYSIQSSPLLGSLVATSVITSALAQLFQQPLVAYQITSSTLLANGPAMHIRSIFTLSSVLVWG